MASVLPSQAASPFQWWKPAAFFLVVIVGLWYVKWQPYYGKPSPLRKPAGLGKSILAEANANPLMAAWDCAMVYFLRLESGGARRAARVIDSGLDSARLAARTLGQSRFQGTLLGAISRCPA